MCCSPRVFRVTLLLACYIVDPYVGSSSFRVDGERKRNFFFNVSQKQNIFTSKISLLKSTEINIVYPFFLKALWTTYLILANRKELVGNLKVGVSAGRSDQSAHKVMTRSKEVLKENWLWRQVDLCSNWAWTSY